MNHEISQLDIPDRQLLASNTRPSIWTEIGEAQITHTIFGRAKVRIVRKNDNRHRIFWVTGIAALAIAVAAWQGWFTSRQPEEVQSSDQAAVSANEPVRAPETRSEKIASPETPPEAVKELRAPIRAEVDKPAIPESKPHQAQAPKLPPPKSANAGMSQSKPYLVQPKPVLAQPGPVITKPAAVKPQAVPSAGTQVIKAPAGTVTPVNSLSPKPGSTAVAATKPIAQTAASGAAAAIQLSDPLQKPADSTVDNPPSVPDNAQK
jgi:hypothetical protein